MIVIIVLVVIVIIWVLSTKHKQTVLTYTQNEISDYDVLKQYLTYNVELIPQGTDKKTADFIVASYIEYFCKIHCHHIQSTYPPAQMAATFLGGRVFSINMVVTKVLEDFKKVGFHSTIGDLYEDAFIILGHFGDTSYDIPKIHPAQSNKYILDELCNERLVLQYAKTMNKRYQILPPAQ